MKQGFTLGLQMLVIISILGISWITAAGAINFGCGAKQYFFIPVSVANIALSIVAAYRYAKSKNLL